MSAPRLLSVQPRYDYRDGKAPALTGYDLANVVEVTVRDLGALGAVVDGALTAGATSLDGLTFRVDDPREAERAARTAAVGEARARADVLAAAAGLSDRRRRSDRGGRSAAGLAAAESRPADGGRRRRDTDRGRIDRDRGHRHGDLPDRLTGSVSRQVPRSAAAPRIRGPSRRPCRRRPRRSS